MNCIFALLGALVGAGFFAAGFALGCSFHPRGAKPPAAQNPGEAEALRLEEERRAFENLMGYNASTAYGHGGVNE